MGSDSTVDIFPAAFCLFYFQSKVLCGKLKRRVPGADRIAQQVKARAAKPRDLSSVPWTNVGEEKT